MALSTPTSERVARLRALLTQEQILLMPACFDGLSAKLVERAGYDATFMTGFGVSAVHGFPDTQAPRSVDEMAQYCSQVPGYKMANMVENGLTPVLLPEQLQAIGYTIALYPVTLLSASIKAMESALALLRTQHTATGPTSEASEAGDGANATPSRALGALLCDFAHVKDVVGFTEYYAEEERYDIARGNSESR
ncbi:hypothetical protein PybrP1_008912 [[Pythium] brassicae (nom. inval.)]|nr:hypothetical protein PybrP1_008912 [[Pythium] brassicae (nom. inval.)]